MADSWFDETTGQVVNVSQSKRMPVELPTSGTPDPVNLTQAGGTAVNAGIAAQGALPIIPLTSTTAATWAQGFKTVSASGTPEPLVNAQTLVTSVVMQGYKAQGTLNTGTVYVGSSASDAVDPIALLSGYSMVIVAPPGKVIDLHTIYLDVATNGDGVGYLAII